MDQLIKFALDQWPGVAMYLILATMVISLVGFPFAITYWILGLKNKHRYVLANSNNYLYRMDSYDGSIYKAQREKYIEVEFVTKKEHRDSLKK